MCAHRDCVMCLNFPNFLLLRAEQQVLIPQRSGAIRENLGVRRRMMEAEQNSVFQLARTTPPFLT